MSVQVSTLSHVVLISKSMHELVKDFRGRLEPEAETWDSEYNADEILLI